ncbi:MAG: serine/threonine-protein kinase, partial [Myxococcota bacterium]
MGPVHHDGHPSSPAVADRSAVGMRFGDFVVAAPLAVGGMAEVFLAARATAYGNEICAIKRLLPHLTWETEFVRMFLDEVRIASGLTHPNIAAVHDYGTGEGGHYLAMEYVHGRDLRSLLRAAGNTTPPMAFGVGVVAELADALQYAHQYVSPDFAVQGLVHRDVSRSNVMVTFDGQVKLLDFGIARATGRTQYTRAGTFKGKIGYMAPEQCRGEAVDRRTDVFSAGVLLYELTTGRRAFYADNDFAVLGKILSGSYAAPSAVAPGYPPELEAIVVKAMAVDPAARTEQASHLAGALREFAARHGLDLSPRGRAAYLHQLCGSHPMPQLDVPSLLRAPASERPARARTAVLIGALTAVVGGAGFAMGAVTSEPEATPDAAAPGVAAEVPSD